jgi:hypothetical protein
VSTAPPPREIWKEFSGEKAFAEVKKQVDLGPRPAGSAELEQTRGLLTASLEANGWEVERQEFTDTTPHGAVKFVNLIARFAADGSRPVPRTTQRAIVCSHYDTKRFSTIRFVGADDGASSTGALVELARVLALDPAFARNSNSFSSTARKPSCNLPTPMASTAAATTRTSSAKPAAPRNSSSASCGI